MSENLRTFTKAAYMLDAVAARVPTDAWDNASCCEGWTAREVAGHAAWFIKNIGSLAAGQGTIAEQAEAEVLGDDPAAGMRQAISQTLEQLDRPGSLSQLAETPFGEMSIDNFIGAVWIDPLTHAWDVADATGIAHGIDEASADAALVSLQQVADGLRRPGMFNDVSDAGGDDAVAKYIAFSGRTSVR